MNRSKYFDYIEERLNLLASRINSRGRLNILDLHLQSENFFAHFLNKLYFWELGNMNDIKANVESIDLICHKSNIVIQVSATNTKKKVETGLEKESIKNYLGYTFKFISISNDADNLRGMTFDNPHGITFDPKSDIIDKKTILNGILMLDIESQKTIYEFIKKELGNEVDIVKLDSNLATVINILSKENLSITFPVDDTKQFDIAQKITYNQLDKSRVIIEDYSLNHIQLDKKYVEFDIQGVNKSFSVLQSIKKMYVEVIQKLTDPDSIFLSVIDNVVQKVQDSANFNKIPIDELELCANIVVVDAFIRCKIFENPNT
jgi:hypothetical protein